MVTKRIFTSEKFRIDEMLFLLAVSSAFVADTIYSLRILKVLPDVLYLNLVTEILYGVFAVLLTASIVQSFRTSALRDHVSKISILIVFAIHIALSWKFIELPYYASGKYPLSLMINSTIYAIALAVMIATVLPLSSRLIDRRSYWLAQTLLLFLTADFALRYQTSFVDLTSFSWAEFGWANTFVGFAWIVYASEGKPFLFSGDAQLSPVVSVRNLLTLVICGTNILFLLGILAFRIYTPANANEVSSILLLIYVFWILANEFSWRLATDLGRVTPLLFQGHEQEAETGAASFRLQTVEIPSSIFEISQILTSYNHVVKKTNQMFEIREQANRDATIAKVASQVSHDIRSPLTMLNFVTAKLSGVPEETRVMIRQATQRINDIANDLMVPKGNQVISNRSERTTATLIGPVVDSIMSEKRIQYRSRDNVTLSQKIDQSYGLFSLVRISELNRCISNLIDNAVESISDRPGIIDVEVKRRDQDLVITISDNGRGIPEEIRAQIGTRGFSYGKEGKGSGLGFHHAINTIRTFGGDLNLASTENVGTRVTINLPLCESPKWFAQFIDLDRKGVLVSVDDDQTIHSIWSNRLSNELGTAVQHIQFHSVRAFSEWANGEGNPQTGSNTYLIDYEFTDQDASGIDAIREIKDLSKTYLVTSRHDEPRVVAECDRLGIKIIPKAFAGVVPFQN